MNDKEKILAAKARIQKGWTKWAFAVNLEGCAVRFDNPNAVCWCLRGAFDDKPPDIIYKLTRGMPGTWNDQPERTKDEVLELLDNALELLDE